MLCTNAAGLSSLIRRNCDRSHARATFSLSIHLLIDTHTSVDSVCVCAYLGYGESRRREHRNYVRARLSRLA